MILTLTVTQEADCEAKITDARGNPAHVQNPTWSASEPDVLTVTVDASNPLKATVKAAGPVDEASQVKFECDADLGEGVLPIFGLLDVVVSSGQAVAVEIQAGPPREQK